MATDAVLDFDRLLSPLSAENPTGKDLSQDTSDDPIFWRIKSARDQSSEIEAKYLAEKAIGKEAHEAGYSRSQCRWAEVVQESIGVLADQSKDYWIAAWMCEGLLRQDGFVGLREGFRLARELAERFWEDLHPGPKDGHDVARRVSQFRGLFSGRLGGTLVLPVRQVPVTQGPGYSDLDYEQAQALEKIADADERQARLDRGAVSLQQFEQQAMETSCEFYRELIGDLRGAMSELQQLVAVLEVKCGKDEEGNSLVPSPRDVMKTLEGVLATVMRLAGSRLAEQEGAGETQDAGETFVLGSDGRQLARETAGQRMTRELAIQRLHEVAEFFRRTEPHSPISHHVEEAIRWGLLSLPDLLTELIPQENVREELFTRIGIRKGESPDGR
jgi:type VI secretion system protein ImpA